MSAISHVIAGVSGSPRSLPALRYAAALARGHGAALIPLPGTACTAGCSGTVG
jgi:hypothetical protein